MMRIILCVMFGVWAAAGGSALAQVSPAELEEAKAYYMGGNYAGAYTRLQRIREQDFGKSFEVDFILGVCACALGEHRRWGESMLNWVVTTYGDKLTEQGRRAVESELTNCRGGQRPSGRPYEGLVLAGARMQGKTFYWGDSRPASSLSIRAVPLPASGVAPRPVPRGQAAAAERQARQAMPEGRTRVFSRFVITSGANHTDKQFRDLNELLERYLDFFVRQYGMRQPASYMHAYLLPNVAGLNQFASRYHRMQPSYGTIAYSFRDDLSVVAVIPGGQYGSVFHELFHLMARSNFGDIPTWLDEGAAALYEVSVLEGREARGVPNWRGKILQQFSGDIPSLNDLIRQTASLDPYASELSLQKADLARDATRAATARYFALYLQDKGKLFATYAAVQGFSSSPGFDGTTDGMIRHIEQAVGQPLAELDRDFQVWLAKVAQTAEPRVDTRLQKAIPPAPRSAPGSGQ